MTIVIAVPTRSAIPAKAYLAREANGLMRAGIQENLKTKKAGFF